MNLNFWEIIPSDFADDSRVWIYQADRSCTDSEIKEIEKTLKGFAAEWSSHGDKVKGFAGILFGQFMVFMADETAMGVSGCSTDSSVRLVKSIEQQFDLQLFDRLKLAFIINDKTVIIDLNLLDQAIENDQVNDDTPYFNNNVLTKKEFLEKWIIPVKDSWLGNKFIINNCGNSSSGRAPVSQTGGGGFEPRLPLL